MLKLILKNLWSRRRNNGWLMAELILVAILSWIIFDPVIVVTYDRQRPLGYDADRLCMVSVALLQSQAPDYDAQANDSASLMQAYMSIIERTRQHTDVKYATPITSFAYPCSMGSSSSSLTAEGDSTDFSIINIYFWPHTNFFETYGFKQGEGSMTESQLSDYTYRESDIILTEDAMKEMFHSKTYSRQCCWSAFGQDTTYMSVVGTVKPFKYANDLRPAPVAFIPVNNPNILSSLENLNIVIRIKDGVSMERFLHDFKPWMLSNMRASNLYARDLQSYDDLIADSEFYSSTSLYRRNLSVAMFFLINLCLGVIGTFWLQTRTRREEIGVMLSYGATPHNIRRLLLGEGVALTTIATLIGCIIYMQYGLSEGLHQESIYIRAITQPCWVENFVQHFLIVSFIIYIILLLVVLTGIYIPAHRISNIAPTEALRNE